MPQPPIGWVFNSGDPPAHPVTNLVYAGNSISVPLLQFETAHVALLAPWFDVPQWLKYEVWAVGGATIENLISQYTGNISPLYDGTKATNLLFLMEGTNSMNPGIGNDTGAQAAAAMATLIADGQATGFTVIVATCLPSTFVTEANRTTYNTTLITNASSSNYTIADIASDPVMGQAGQQTNTTYYTDGVHPTRTGMAEIAPIVANALRPLIPS